jgi:hypothetical protein
MEPLQSTIQEFIDLLNGEFSPHVDEFTIGGSYIVITSITAMFGFGSKENPLVSSLSKEVSIADTTEYQPYHSFILATRFTNEIFKIILQQILICQDDPSLLSFIHCMLVFIDFMARRSAMCHLEPQIPWLQLVESLNFLVTQPHLDHKISLPSISLFQTTQKLIEQILLFPEDFEVLKEDLVVGSA